MKKGWMEERYLPEASEALVAAGIADIPAPAPVADLDEMAGASNSAVQADLDLLVEQMVAASERPEVISRAIGCPVEELQDRFGDALENGLARRRCEALNMLWRKAREGHAMSIDKVVAMTGAALGEETFARDADAAGAAEPARKVYRGKKEMAKEAALSAGEGTEWGDDLSPAGALQ